METIRAILCAVLGTLVGFIFGGVCGSAISVAGMPPHPTNYDGVGAALWMMIGAGLGAFVGLILGMCVPSWRHNLQRQKRLQTLGRQRSRRAFTSGAGIWPPAPKSEGPKS